MEENRPIEERLYYIDTQKINLEDIKINGLILDIGGGGEGIIGQVFGNQVVAIDPSKEELEGSAQGPLKIVMDARNLSFLDFSFDNVTSFFTMMYIPLNEHETVLRELYRVLKWDGELYIWEVVIPAYDQSGKDIFVIPLEVKIKEKVIETGYGTKWTGREQNSHYFIDLCKKVGFEVVDSKAEGETFLLRLKKNKAGI